MLLSDSMLIASDTSLFVLNNKAVEPLSLWYSDKNLAMLLLPNGYTKGALSDRISFTDGPETEDFSAM